MNLHQDLKEYYNPPAKNGVHYTSKIRTEILILTNSYRDISITTKKIGSRYLQGLGDWTSLSLNYTFDEESLIYPYGVQLGHTQTSEITEKEVDNYQTNSEFLKFHNFSSWNELFQNANITFWLRDPLDRLLTAVIEDAKTSDGDFTEDRLRDYLHKLPGEFYNHLQFSTYHINDYNRVCYLISLVNEESKNHFPKISDNPNAGDISNDKWKSTTWPNYIDHIMTIFADHLASETLFYHLLTKK